MNWVQINNRLFELESKLELTIEEKEEWDKLLNMSKLVPGIIKRKSNEENIRKTKEEKRRKKEV